jgi:hypothetical protein
VSPEQILALITAASGGGIGAAITAALGWWHRRHRVPLDVAQLAQDVAALAVKHARAELQTAYADAGRLRVELLAARTEIDHLTTALTAARGEIGRLTALLRGSPNDVTGR